MGRRSYGNTNCLKIYPVEGSVKELSDLKTVAFVLSASQAIALATNLLNAARNASQIDVTGFRQRGLISVTSAAGETKPLAPRKPRRDEVSV